MERRSQYIQVLTTCALLLGAEAFIDIRAPEVESDEVIFESQPAQQVHLVFSSHLVSPLHQRHVPRHVAACFLRIRRRGCSWVTWERSLLCHVASHCATHASIAEVIHFSNACLLAGLPLFLDFGSVASCYIPFC